ncbi:outer membrane protein OmpK [Shewanella eurypsychrophilus]|uniref:Outer membrane protein OmpK n=1 Tax=Shewanella eurypsychrophilus TaxID=2593656 RepID=A0ABX6VEA7_9GAMM|nr:MULTISPECIES: outer membrane protein OmpK [Shewanella]QFU25002.1 hypothetical protein FS418_26315 [Shewanella sp. YLB-09]QPG60178.1 outer membrane protein OmpK [Shewanella eurypsychrophilus]
MNKLLKIAVPTLLACACASSMAQAEVFVQKTMVSTGYEALVGDAADNNPTQQDQIFARVASVTVADWGSAIGWLKFENFAEGAEAGNGESYVTTKAWMKVDKNIGDTPFNLWIQSFTIGNQATFEENLYLGASYDVGLGPVKGTVGLGAQYAYGHMSQGPANGYSFASMSGYALVLQLGMPMTKELSAKLYYEGQFNRSEEHQALGYDDTGFQAAVGAVYKLPLGFTTELVYKYRDNWGGLKDTGGLLFAEVSYSF